MTNHRIIRGDVLRGLDPFAGSGTVAKAARDLGRFSISIELNPDYVAIIKRRLRYHEQLSPDITVESEP